MESREGSRARMRSREVEDGVGGSWQQGGGPGGRRRESEAGVSKARVLRRSVSRRKVSAVGDVTMVGSVPFVSSSVSFDEGMNGIEGESGIGTGAVFDASDMITLSCRWRSALRAAISARAPESCCCVSASFCSSSAI